MHSEEFKFSSSMQMIVNCPMLSKPKTQKKRAKLVC